MLNRALKYITISLFFILVAVFFAFEICSYDLWLHLGAGKYIIGNLKVPTFDIFSYTIKGRAWIDHEWLFQVMAYSIYGAFGPNGLVVMRILVFVTAFGFLFALGYRKNNFVVVITALLPILTLARYRFFVHPEIFTLLFTAAYLFFFHKYRHTKFIYILLPIQLLWANIHGYFIIGLIIAFSYIAGEVLARFINLRSRTEIHETLNKGEFRRLFLCGLLLFSVCFVTPYGYKTFFYSVKTLFYFMKHAEFMTTHISELQRPLGPDFNYAALFIYRGVAFISALLILLNIRKINLGQYFVYIIFFMMSVSSNRNIALFSFIAGATMISNINDMAPAWRGPKIMRRLSEYKRVIEATACAFLIVFMSRNIIITAYSQYYVKGLGFKSSNFGVSKKQYSESLIKFIKENNVNGNIFNSFDLGAYLIGNVYPQCRVFMDGRVELYGVDFLQYYQDILTGKASFNEAAEAYGFKYVILKNAKVPPQFLHKLYSGGIWKLVYFDGIASVFAKDTEENKPLIRECEVKLSEPKMDLGRADIEKLRKRKVFPFFYLARSCFYRDVGLYKIAIKEIENALTLNPDCGECYYALGLVYFKEGLYPEAIRAYKQAIKKRYDNEYVRNNLGAVYGRMELLDWAAKEYRKALRFNPKYLIARKNLNISKKIQKLRDEEITKLDKNIFNAEGNRKKADAYYEVAKEFYNIKCFVSAIMAFNSVLELNPGFPEKAKIYNASGVSFTQLGLYERAGSCFKNALKIEPKNTITLCHLGSLYMNKGEFDKAEGYWQKALAIDPACKAAQENLKKIH